jgi:hypothetical protein
MSGIPNQSRASIFLKSFFRFADNVCMRKNANGSWYVTKKGKAISVVGSDSSLVAVLPKRKTGPDTKVKEAYLIAASPQLFEVCCKIKAILENNLIVTQEGFQIDCSEIKEILLDATLRASGCRKAPEEP